MKNKTKICIPVIEKELKCAKNLICELLNVPCDVIEWRIDYYIEDENDFQKKIQDLIENLRELFPLIKEHKKELIITYRSQKQGGVGKIDSKMNEQLLLTLAECGLMDYLDVEFFEYENSAELIQKIQSFGVKVVASNHDFFKTDKEEQLFSMLEAMRIGNPNIVKLAVMPKSNEDVVSLLKVTKKYATTYQSPIITMSMGEMGKISRIIGNITGSCWTFASYNQASAPGQIPLEELIEWLNRSKDFYENKEIIYFIGFMGVGKSAVALELSKILDMPLWDMDEEIEKINQMKISDMFETYGEDYFREKEIEFLKSLQGEKGRIISCGGGVIVREENRKFLKENGLCVYLRGRPETILSHIQGSSHRPLLKNNMNVEGISNILKGRKEFYEECGRITLDVDEKSISQCALELLLKVIDRKEG